MHRNIRKLLDNAEGVSEYIIAVNLDIRGFSEFSKRVESPDTAMYIKRVYMKLVDEYFADASFFKPTGDGLVLTFPFKEQTLKTVFNSTIRNCWKAHEQFSKICKDDPMINFSVPQKIGIGIARGTACRIVSKKKTIDYSGHVLNLASRLMDIARPSGIVFHDEFGKTLLGEREAEKFASTKVYLKGIAEDEPMSIFYSKSITKIASIHKSPLNKIIWKQIEKVMKSQEVHSLNNFRFSLPERPTDPDEILVTITHPGILRGRKIKGMLSFGQLPYKYVASGDSYEVQVDMAGVANYLEIKGVKKNWEVKFIIKYPVKHDSKKTRKSTRKKA